MTEIYQNNIPSELKALPQWVAWSGKNRNNGKKGKMPVNPMTGKYAKINDPNTWTNFDDAVKYYQENLLDGVGFVFSEHDDFIGIDLDQCIDRNEGIIEAHSESIIRQFNSYTEISPSGEGVHIFVKGELPAGGRKSGNIEIYDTRRFFTVTGNTIDDSPNQILDRSDEIINFHNTIFTGSANTSIQNQPLQKDDDELIKKAKHADNGEKFTHLWNGNHHDYRSPSEADLALCQMLSFWTNRDPAKIDRLFRRSELCREKWDKMNHSSGQTYGQATIQKAIGSTTKIYEIESQKIHLTDLGNAERLVDQFGNDILYCYDWKKWLVWDGKRWAIDREGNIRQKAKKAVRAIYREIESASDKSEKKDIFNHAMKSESDAKIRAMISLAQDEVSITPERLDQDPWLLTCDNGTIDLQTGNFLPHDRLHLITQLAPVLYNPHAECPQWLNFLDRIMDGNQKLISFLQRAIGYSLTGDTGEQCFFIFWGTGANGKTTFLQTINAILGDYAKQTPTETLLVKKKGAIPNDVARLKGVRFVTASEAEAYQKFAENLIKQMTGSDTVSARFLHQEWFDFEPSYKIFLATNHRPIIQGTDPAIWRRIKLIPFNITIPELDRDRHLLHKLKQELPGILAWAVQGCMEWKKNGLGEPDEVKEATREYRNEMDVLSQFISDCCEEDASSKELAKDLYESYCQWCAENREENLSKRMFGSKLKEKGYANKRVGQSRSRAWVGLRLLPQDPNPDKG